MMKKIYLFIGFVLVSIFSFAQQIGMLSHYYTNPMIYNPAFTGENEKVNAMIISKNQWTGFRGAPQLNLFTLDGNIHDKAGLGMQLLSDRKGLINRIGGNVSYSYRFLINDETYFRLGASIGVFNQYIDYSKAIVENNADPNLFTTREQTLTLDANAGLAFKWKGLDIGIAIPQLANNKANFVDNLNVRSYYMLTRHYMGSVQYKIPVSEELGLSVIPLALVRYLPNAPLQYDGTLTINWKDRVWAGATYKSDYAVGINAGITVHQKFSLGYSYDYIIGKIGAYSGMSHEIMLSYRFGGKNTETGTISEAVIPKPEKEKRKREDKVLTNALYEHRMDSLQLQIDSLSKFIVLTQESIKNMQTNMSAVQNHADTLQENVDALKKQLQENEEKIKQLTDKLGELKQTKQLSIVPASENKNAEAIESNKDRTMIEGIWFVKDKTKEFDDDTNHEPQKGFYVIVGTFIYRDYAVAEVKRFRDGGFKKANWVYCKNKKFNYVHLKRISEKDKALTFAKEVQASGIKDVWVQELVKDIPQKDK